VITQTVSSKAEELLRKSAQKSARIIEGADLSAAFGVDLAEETVSPRLDEEDERARPADLMVRNAALRKTVTNVGKAAVTRKMKKTVKKVANRQTGSGKNKK
jgi:hypothetical protein